jgi:hypothetical protein
MLTYPVVSVAILLAFLKIGEKNEGIKSPFLIVGILLGMTAVSALIGVLCVVIFKPDLSSLVGIMADESTLTALNNREALLKKPLDKMITDFISTNPFADLAGARSVSLASIVIFFSFVGFAFLSLKKSSPDDALKFQSMVEVAYKILMILVGFALKITPYGVLGLFAKISINLDLASISKLLNFVLISYLATFVMFIFHGFLLGITGTNPLSYYKKTFELLVFGFFSRSSSASIPLNIKTQVEKLGISPHNATISASFGSIVGQNGCAGIYPAMLVAMVGAGMGVDVSSINFILYLILVVTVNSLGIAGVGGGAIFAAIASLSVFEMPFAIIALLAGIEPIIDMARTALNINGAVVSSVITDKFTSNSSKDG